MPSNKRDRLRWLIERGHIAPEYEDLGDLIIKLAELKSSELRPRTQLGGSDGGAGNGKSEAAIIRPGARQRWEKLFSHIQDKGEAVVWAVIVEGMTTEEAAKALNLHPKAIVPMLQMSLEILGSVA